MLDKKQIITTKYDNKENGIVVPAILWWLGVPISLLLILWLIGVL